MSDSDNRITKGVITVAGLGTRLLPASKAIPKEMMPVLGKPVLQYIVKEMAESGIEDILFVTGKGKQAIEDHFDRDLDYEKYLKQEGKYDRIESIVELSKQLNFFYTRQSEPLGNGHALLQAKQFVEDEPFVFSDGDSVMDYDKPPVEQMIDAFQEKQSSILGVQKIENKEEMTKYGNVYTSSAVSDKIFEVERLVEKPSVENVSDRGIIIAGMRYVFTSEIWEYLETQEKGKDNEIWVSDAANRMVKDGKNLYACEYEGQYFDTGTKEALFRAQLHFAKKVGLID